MPIHPSTVSINGFKGLDNIHSPESTNPSFLKKALNIDIDTNGKIVKRQGYVLKDSGNYKSIFSSINNLGCYAVKNGDLVIVNNDYSSTIIKANIGNFDVSFEEVDNLIFFVSPNTSGIIKDKKVIPWGIDCNFTVPNLSYIQGTLPSGTYQVSVTYINNQGIESGTGHASIITIPNNSNISVDIPVPSPNNSDIIYAKVYCSTPDGNTLYYSGVSLLNNVYIISDIHSLISPLKTFNLDKPPLGTIVKYYNGRMYIVVGNILYYTQPYMYHHINYSTNYIEFSSDILEVMPTEDGIWVCSDRIYYLSGNSPDQFILSVKEEVKVVPGTSTKFSGSYLHMDNAPPGYKWIITTNVGIFVLFNQGVLANVTSSFLSPSISSKGTGVFLQQNGMNSYLSILEEKKKENNSVFGDLVEATIIRNGNIIS